ncbi:hypothetical protein PG984_010480 [Apiospora sp. TS-2023a]
MPTSSYRRLLPPDWEESPTQPWPPLPPAQQPPEGQPKLVLFSADFWHVSSPDSYKSLYPPLEILVDSLITAILESPDGTLLQNRLGVYMSALYSQAECLKDRSFAGKLSPDNRHYHQDGVTGMPVTTIPVIKRQREFRDKIRESRITTQPKTV